MDFGQGISDQDIQYRLQPILDAMIRGDDEDMKRQARNMILGENDKNIYDQINTNLSIIADIENLLKETDTGVITGNIQSFQAYALGTGDSKLIELATKLDDLSNRILIQRSGASYTDQGEQRIANLLGNIYKEPQYISVRLNAFADNLKTERDTQLKRKLGDKYDIIFGNKTISNQHTFDDILKAGQEATIENNAELNSFFDQQWQ